MLYEFSKHITNAVQALRTLGLYYQHEQYMQTHIDTMDELHNDRGNASNYSTLQIQPKLKSTLPESSNTSKAALLNFSKYLKEEEKLSDEEVQKLIDELTWEDIVDLYSDVELVYDPDEDDNEVEEELKEDFLDEALSVQARLKKRQAFARMRGKRNVARGMKLRRASTTTVLKKRATIAARRAVYKRFLRGRDKATLSAAEKDRIERQVKNMKYLQQTLATKMLPRMRAIEQKRLSSKRGVKTMKPSKAPKYKKK
jgi:hypothetical protein